MTRPAPPRATRSLAATVVWRLLAVLAVALIVGVGAFAWLYEQTRQAAQAQQLVSTARHFEIRFGEIDHGWHLAAKNLRSQVAHTRILDDRSNWQQRLTAYLVTLADGIVFTHVLLVDPAGRVRFSYQPGGQAPPSLPPDLTADAGWLFAPGESAVYRMIALPMLVQGQGGHRLVLLVALDNVLLSASVYPGVEAHLLWQGRVVASSRGNAVVGRAATELAAADSDQRSTALLWGAEAGAPLLMLQHESLAPVSVTAAVLPFALAGGLLALGGWLVLGGWVARLAVRLDVLKQAARRFSGADRAGVQAAASDIESRLTESSGHDDLSDLAVILAAAMKARLAAEDALRVKDDAIAASLNAMVFTDLAGRLLYVNRAFLQLWGYAHEREVIGHTALDFTAEAAQTTRALEALRACGSWSGELAARRRDGSVFTVLGTATLIRDAGGQPVQLVGSFFDISDRRRAEEQVQRLNATLEERVQERTAALAAAVRELEAFSYSVSHDLRAPLRAIDGFSRLLLDEHAAQLNAEGHGLLVRVRQAAQRMGVLIDELLELSRVGRAELRVTAVDLSVLAAEVVEQLRIAEPARRVQVTIAPALRARGDERLLRLVLENLIGNAWKYTSRTPDARIEVSALEHDGERVFRARDNGVGFDMAYADKLFQPFQRLHRAGEFDGTGVGLATVARIVHRHGGRVWGESQPGAGATFFFTLGGAGGKG